MTKAETLYFLRDKLEHSRIAPLEFLTLADWKQGRQNQLQHLQKSFKDQAVIVRSSAIGEDSSTSSMAGRYCSLLNVNSSNADDLGTAIDTVFSSYEDNSQNHQVLVQPMIANVILSGVAFTQDQRTGAPYIVISYDDETAQTDTITSGSSVSKSLRIWRGTSADKLTSKRMRKVYQAIEELESVMGSDTLDIEFAVDDHYRVWTLQVRPLVLDHKLSTDDIQKLEKTLNGIHQEVTHLSKPDDDLYGARTLLGDMSDWNPAEMIGINPMPLAYSLYHRLITSDIWHLARAGMGYRPMDGHHLMEKIGGHPFIDIRKSFNSFLPEGIDPLTAERLVNAWMSRLAANHALYDKVEFEVVTTCHTPSFNNFFSDNYDQVLTDKQYAAYSAQLKELTSRCVTGRVNYNIDWCEQQAVLLEKEQQKNSLQQMTAGAPQETIKHIEILIDQCRDMGTKPFSAAARHAFIGEAVLRSCQAIGAISPETVSCLKTSFSTISNRIVEGMSLIAKDEKSRIEFFKNFGHIRPSSYDIVSPRYDTMESFIGPLPISFKSTEDVQPFTMDMIKNLDAVFKSYGYIFTAEQFIAYYIKSVQMREWIKLIFTRSLSDIIECAASIGREFGYDRADMSFVPIDSLISCVQKDNPKEALAEVIAAQKKDREAYRAVYMNYLIEDAKDIYVIPVQRSTPNFITNKRITAPSITLSENEAVRGDLAGKIICIERADPGFDWIFGCGIAGLITKYGGANSHMAIRCSEFSLPAGIGCGELIYSRLQNAREIEMDCQAGKIVALSAV